MTNVGIYNNTNKAYCTQILQKKSPYYPFLLKTDNMGIIIQAEASLNKSEALYLSD